jgi:hypothetical protein
MALSELSMTIRPSFTYRSIGTKEVNFILVAPLGVSNLAGKVLALDSGSPDTSSRRC